MSGQQLAFHAAREEEGFLGGRLKYPPLWSVKMSGRQITYESGGKKRSLG